MISKLRSTVSKAGAAFLMLSLVAACSSPDAEIKPKAEVKTNPVVIANAPLNGAIDISLKPSISASFSETMDIATINETTFTLTAGGTIVKGSVSYSGATAVFVPASPLANETKFTATIFPGAKSASGVALIAAHSWTFSTIAADKLTTPTVLSNSPASGALKVAVDSDISVVFSESMNMDTLNATTFTVTQGSPAVAVAGTVTKTGTLAVFTPSNPLAKNAIMTATITTGAESEMGVALEADHTWSFTTIGITPAALSSTPGDMTTNVAVNAPITVTFSEAMMLSSLHNTFHLTMDADIGIPGTVTYDSATSTATFTPLSALLNNRSFTATISTGAKSSLGVNLIAGRTWSFQTIGVVPAVAFHTPDSIAVNVAVDAPIVVTFDQAMDGTTITDASFSVTGPSVVNGTVTYLDGVATFTPNSALANNTVYTVTLSDTITNALGIAIPGTSWIFTTVGATPTIVSRIPSPSASNVTVSTGISATFSVAMDAASLTGAFRVTRGNPAVNVPGTVSYANMVVTFTPDTMPLATNALYTASITAGAMSTLGVHLAGMTAWTFTTMGAVPVVTATNPINNANFVDVDASISVGFSETMNTASISGSSFTVTSANPAVAVAGSFSFPNASVAVFTPMASLATYTTFYVNLTPGIESALNVPLGMTAWRFTTRGSIPTVSSTSPIDNATFVDVDGSVSVTFSEAMNTTSITGSSFTVTSANPAVTVVGSFGFPSASVAVFTPMASLATDTTYYVQLSQVVESALNVPLAAAYAFSFTTGNPVVLTVDLGTAENFVILAQTAVTAVTNTTYVGGDIGISPGFSEDVTGFSFAETDATEVFFMTSALVKGRVYTADNSAPTPVTVDTAVLDMIDAFDDAAARNANFTDVSLSTVTLPTGVYRFTGSLSITTDVTLSGSATNVWIFQIAGDVTMASDIRVVLTGGAVKENVFWQVDGKVELGTGAHIEGVVLAAESITLYDSAMAKGRLLSQTWVKLYGNSLVNKVPYWNGVGINLRTAHDFVILGKAGISTVPASVITGDIGVSPAAASFMTGFDPVTIDASTHFATCSQVIGKMWAPNYSGATLAKMTAAISDMETAYTFADGMTPLQPTELGAGDISGLILTEGVRYWSSGLLISTDLTLTGSATDVWVFQIDGNLTVTSNVKIILSGGALPENVYWQVAGPAAIDVDIGTGVQFNGIILAATEVLIKTGSSVNGRVYSQTQVSLQQNVVTQPND